MALTEGMSASDECHRLGIVKSHATERVHDVGLACHGVTFRTKRTGRINVDEANGSWSQRRLALPLDSTGTELLLKGIWAENETVASIIVINSPTTKAQDGASHGFNSSVAGQDDEIAPGEGSSELLLDWLQEFQSVVKIGVVIPKELGIEADSAAIAATTAV
jgi:hypothetical protein